MINEQDYYRLNNKINNDEKNEYNTTVIMIKYLEYIYFDNDKSLDQKLNIFKKSYGDIKKFTDYLRKKYNCTILCKINVYYKNLLTRKKCEIQFNKEIEYQKKIQFNKEIEYQKKIQFNKEIEYQKKKIHEEILAERNYKELIKLEEIQNENKIKLIKKKEKAKLNKYLKNIFLI